MNQGWKSKFIEGFLRFPTSPAVIYNFTASFSFDCSATCGLWLDADLYHGRTQHCDTFENEPLTGDVEDFIIRGIEIWSLNDEEYD